jgi:hypothetical protein
MKKSENPCLSGRRRRSHVRDPGRRKWAPNRIQEGGRGTLPQMKFHNQKQKTGEDDLHPGSQGPQPHKPSNQSRLSDSSKRTSEGRGQVCKMGNCAGSNRERSHLLQPGRWARGCGARARKKKRSGGARCILTGVRTDDECVCVRIVSEYLFSVTWCVVRHGAAGRSGRLPRCKRASPTLGRGWRYK